MGLTFLLSNKSRKEKIYNYTLKIFKNFFENQGYPSIIESANVFVLQL